MLSCDGLRSITLLLANIRSIEFEHKLLALEFKLECVFSPDDVGS